uniref:Uncharacterized protein n=1 Tax=Rhizophora mucronata TaxID=61149 RepID=A0A2P2PJZ0_RHIMU
MCEEIMVICLLVRFENICTLCKIFALF